MSKILLVELFFANVNDFGTVSLTKEEQHKFDTLKSPKRRQEYAISRWLRRKVLSQKLNQQPETLNFETSKHDKPFLKGQVYYFNISHSHEWIILAICKSNDIGIDIQKIEPKRNLLEIAKQYFSASEYKQLNNISDANVQITQLYKLWTAKEAALKAIGTGIAGGLDKYIFSITNNIISLANTYNIALAQFNYETNYILSLALIASSNSRLEIQSYRVTNANKLIKINL